MLNIFATTWNMGGSMCPSDATLRKWLSGYDACSLVAISVQECEHAASIVPRFSVSRFQNSICQFMGSTHRHIASSECGATGIHCFVRKDLSRIISNVGTANVPLGFLGACNKGAVAVLFSVISRNNKNTRPLHFRFISAHFTSDEGRVMARDSDFHRVQNSLGADSRINEFWLGDFNYRVQASRGCVSRRLLEKEYLAALLPCDELLQERESGAAFEGFEECPIHFKPTYKWTMRQSYAERRVPSWTDRILFRIPDFQSHNNFYCDHSYYDARPSFGLSDHQPVVLKLSLSS